MESNGNEDNRHVDLGLWKVDLKRMLLVKADEPEKEEEHKTIQRGDAHDRKRPSNNLPTAQSRFSGDCVGMARGGKNTWQYNFLG
jgi:hypothetical protein